MVTYNYIDADFEMGKYFYPPTNQSTTNARNRKKSVD